MSSIAKISFNTADGKSTSLAEFEGKVVLVVNVASKCGLTPQYDGLEKMYEKYRARGFSIVGFPANEFGSQEPGTNAEIQDFCRMNFGVQFPVFEKIVVKGSGQHPIYQKLTEARPVAIKKAGSGFAEKLQQHGLLTGKPNEIMWNFEKFLINRKGEVVERFAPDITSDDALLVSAVEAELVK
jgi:glutathione peroxidase